MAVFGSILANPADGIFNLRSRPALIQAGAVVLGTFVLALSSYISVPMVPVPVTMQTFAISMIGALYGWRLGALTVIAWLLEAVAGAPVLAGGAGGIAPFMGPTAGYLFAFPFAAAIAGWLAERGWAGQAVVRSFAAHFASNVLCLVVGASYLAHLIGAEAAIANGFTPFVIGAVLKSALAAAVLKALAGRVQIAR